MFFFSSRRRHTRSVSAFRLNRSSDLKVKNVLALALVVRSRCEVLKASVKALVFRSEERFSRNAETDLVCRLLLEKKKKKNKYKLQFITTKENVHLLPHH